MDQQRVFLSLFVLSTISPDLSLFQTMVFTPYWCHRHWNYLFRYLGATNRHLTLISTWKSFKKEPLHRTVTTMVLIGWFLDTAGFFSLGISWILASCFLLMDVVYDIIWWTISESSPFRHQTDLSLYHGVSFVSTFSFYLTWTLKHRKIVAQCQLD